jgi:hypothetical protein
LKALKHILMVAKHLGKHASFYFPTLFWRANEANGAKGAFNLLIEKIETLQRLVGWRRS